MSRYFIVFYRAYSETNQDMINGCMNIERVDGKYINMIETVKDIKKHKEELQLDKLVFTNIIELAEQDFISWNE